MQGNGGLGNETVFTMAATPFKYGPGAAEKVGWENRLPEVIIRLMKGVGVPRGVRKLGYDEGTQTN